jgi:hypothetical protein
MLCYTLKLLNVVCQDEIEEAMINRINIVGQNGNDGLHYHDIEVNEENTL